MMTCRSTGEFATAGLGVASTVATGRIATWFTACGGNWTGFFCAVDATDASRRAKALDRTLMFE